MNRPLAVIVALAACFLLYRGYAGLQKSPDISHYARFSPLPAGSRLTIVSPHLDDETLGLGGLIAQARREGTEVSVVFMTNGDDNPIGADLQFSTGYPTPEQLIQSGMARQQEALVALADLGVAKDHIYFLGLPDRSLTALLSPRYATTPFTAPGTLRSSSPYALSYVKNLPYTGTAAQDALRRAVQETHPTLVLTTLPEDTHKDHEATSTFVQRLMPSLSGAELDYFLIHYRGFPNPRGVGSSKDLLPPFGLRNDPWEVVLLSPSDIRAKQAAVGRYESQLRIPELGGLMRSMVRQNELLLPAGR